MRHSALRRLSCVVASLGWLACSSGSGPGPDGGATRDGGTVGDGGSAFDGGSGFDGGVLTGDPFDASARATELAAAVCAHREHCEPVYVTYLPQARAQCDAAVAAESLFAWNALVPLLSAGRVVFSRAAFDRCVASYAQAQTDCALGPDPLACEGLFRGNRPVGAACSASPECATGAWCHTPSAGACGTCAAVANSGDDCATNVCGAGLKCITINQQGTMRCSPTTAALGAPCGTLPTGLCRGHLQCNGPQAGPFACQRPAARGQACDTTGVMADCDILAQDVCIGGLCGALAIVGPPSACGTVHPSNLCNADARCNTGTSQCVALAAVGSACNATVACAKGLYCRSNTDGGAAGTCATDKDVGVACAANAECREQNYCIHGACGPLSFAVCAP